MRSLWCGLFYILFIAKSQAFIYKRTEYFLDIELSKKDFLITCSGSPRDNNSILSFHLLDKDTYYNFYYRRVITVNQCQKHKKEYLDILKGHDSVRIVASHPTERLIHGSEKKAAPNPFKDAVKIIYGPFIRLQGGDKCKAYFSEHCDLPKNYWGGVNPE